MADPARHRFPRSARLRSKPEFDRLFREGLRASDRLLTVLAGPNGTGMARLGISAPRRLGNAVRRNRVKRLVREVFRTLRHELPPGTDWVVVPRPESREASLGDVSESLRRLIGRVLPRLGAKLNRPLPGPTAE